MPAGFYNEEQPGFGLTVAISVCLHIVFLTLIFLFAKGNYSKKIITPIYTVDLVAPEKITTPPKIIEPTNHRTSELKSRQVKEEKAIALKKTKEPSLDEALKKIKEHVKKREEEESINRAIEGLQNRQLEKKIKEIRERVAHKQGVVKTVKTQEQHPNTQKAAAMKRLDDLEEKYAQLVGDLIHNKWNYAEDINKGDIAVLDVRIDKTGQLIESRIEQSSGNAMLEKSAVRAIEKAAPLFPPIPQELGKDFVEIGVCFPRCGKE